VKVTSQEADNSHFTSWHHTSRSWGGLLTPVGALEQKICKYPP